MVMNRRVSSYSRLPALCGHGVARQARRRSHSGLAATTNRPRHRTRDLPPLHLTKMRHHR